MLFSSKINKKANLKKLNLLKNNHRRDLEDSILILQKIKEFNNQQGTGKGSILKNYTQRKQAINNMIDLSIESLQQKIMDIDD
ncbi:MAG: hypothetical protein ACLR6T_07015 [Intestinibacter sp.]